MLKKASLTVLLIISLCFPCFSAINFDGTNDYLASVLGVLDSAENDYTVSFWVKTGNLTTDATFSSDRIGSNYGYKFHIYIDGNDTDKVFFVVYTGSGAEFTEFSNDTVLLPNTWYYIAYIHDGVNDLVYGYVNAVVASTSSTRDFAQSNQVTIGAWRHDSGNIFFFDGQISDYAIWNKVLSFSDIMEIYHSKLKHTPLQVEYDNLVIYLPLDDHPHSDTANSANGLTFLDMSTKNNYGTATGCVSKSESFLSYP